MGDIDRDPRDPNPMDGSEVLRMAAGVLGLATIVAGLYLGFVLFREVMSLFTDGVRLKAVMDTVGAAVAGRAVIPVDRDTKVDLGAGMAVLLLAVGGWILMKIATGIMWTGAKVVALVLAPREAPKP